MSHAVRLRVYYSGTGPHHINRLVEVALICPQLIAPAGGVLPEFFRRKKLTLDDLASTTISLITVSYRTPKSLANGVASWNASGLLGLVDQKARV